MSRSVYVASPHGLTGKSAAALGLLDAVIAAVQAQATNQTPPVDAAAAGTRA